MSQLVTLKLPDLEKIQKLYTQNWPKYCTEFFCLNTFIEFLKIDKNLKNFQAFSFGNQELGLFLIVDRYNLFVGCLESSQTDVLLEQALGHLNWSQGLQCTTLPARYLNAVRNVIEAKQLTLEYEVPTDFYHLPVEQALKISVNTPPGFCLRSLDIKDAQQIDQHWAWKQPGSLYFLQRQIKHCVSMGLYQEHNQELVAWCIRDQSGLLTTLHVKDSHKRRGFGSLVVREFSRRVAHLGQDVIAEVKLTNMASAGLFRKVGFQVISQCCWLAPKPTTKKLMWPDGE